MMRGCSLLICISLALPLVGRAGQQTAPAAAGSAPATATAATAESTSATTLPATVEKTPAQLKKEAAEAKIRQYGSNGYKPETTKTGDIVYCKKEAPIGSRFETKQCRTFEQLLNEAQAGKEYLEQMQRVVPPNKG